MCSSAEVVVQIFTIGRGARGMEATLLGQQTLCKSGGVLVCQPATQRSRMRATRCAPASCSGMAADTAPAAHTEHSLTLWLRILVCQELKRLNAIAQHMSAHVTFCCTCQALLTSSKTELGQTELWVLQCTPLACPTCPRASLHSLKALESTNAWAMPQHSPAAPV
jgi:hypothetical protein